MASRSDPPGESLEKLMLLLRQSKPDTNRISLELKLGRYYLFLPESYRKDMDSTIYYFNRALALSNQLHSNEWKYKTLLLTGNYEYENGAHFKGDSIVRQVIAYYHLHNQLLNEADAWEFLANLLDNGDNYTEPEERNCLIRAEKLYLQIKHKDSGLRIAQNIATIDLTMGKLDTAEQEYLFGFNNSKEILYKSSLHDFEQGLASVYVSKGMYHRALFYQLKLLAELPSIISERESLYWSQTAVTYSYLGMHEKALYCEDKALAAFKTKPDNAYYFFYGVNNAVKELLILNKPIVALATIKNALKRKSPENVPQKALVFRDFAQCYAALKQNKLANQYFDAMAKICDGYLIGKVNSYNISGYIIDFTIAIDYYIKASQYKKAKYYFQKIAPLIDNTFVAVKTRVLPLEIKLDSAAGNYKKAFYDLSYYKKISDSVYNSTKSQQIADMQTRYETSQKEQAIQLLQSQGKTQTLELHSTQTERNVTLIGIGFLLLLTGLAYNRYQFKQRANTALEAKQQEINLKNKSLERLLSDKDQLLTEKDWLIKEVHHRVKNNLHTMLSLLESQAKFLSGDALNAVRTSQHRLYAMSLIHHKLYQDNQIATIDIALYLQEFIQSLRDSFGTDENIKFKLNLQPLKIDAAKAIPVALIVNEAVTNAIKYAFPGVRKGEISIVIKETAGQIKLIITDNGIGINPELIDKELDSMGLVLMKGLTTELKGELMIESFEGTSITVIFNCDNSSNQADGLPLLYS